MDVVGEGTFQKVEIVGSLIKEELVSVVSDEEGAKSLSYNIQRVLRAQQLGFDNLEKLKCLLIHVLNGFYLLLIFLARVKVPQKFLIQVGFHSLLRGNYHPL
jgi:hypothetical protein